MKPTYSVRCYAADGSMMGSILENNFGHPLTKREAKNLAKFENDRSAKRRAQNLPFCFDYCAHGWDADTMKPLPV